LRLAQQTALTLRRAATHRRGMVPGITTSTSATGEAVPCDRVADAVDVAAAFRSAMRSFTSSVTLVTARTSAGEWRGMAATSVTSVSMEPPICLVCVNRSASLYPTLMETRLFCINAMHQDHHAAMPGFTKPEHRDSRFRSGSWRLGRDGVPYLEGAQSNIFCELAASVSMGTHDVIFGRVVEVGTRIDSDPLLYGGGAYWRQVAR
jgi:flavin reductase (DIM6/NTAB) family NADH-FMN oxidoreductase RutF